MRKSSLLFFLSALMACESNDSTPSISANARLSLVQSDDQTTFSISEEPRGEAHFIMEDSIVTLTVSLENFLPNTIHAVHIHNGSCEEPAMHWNAGEPHDQQFCGRTSLGISWAKPFAGDVGNVSVGYDGSGSLTIKTDLWTLGTGYANDPIGKLIIIHDRYQDFTTECDPLHDHTHAHNNPKVACGIIE